MVTQITILYPDETECWDFYVTKENPDLTGLDTEYNDPAVCLEEALEMIADKELKGKPYTVQIRWGQLGDVVKTYKFKTLRETEAFLKGIDEADGWLEYDILKQTPKPHNHYLEGEHNG